MLIFVGVFVMGGNPDTLYTRYSIKDLEKITGIKAHTIRIWEQRYKLIQPNRTETNIRYYSDEDLQFILNVSILIRNGYKISRIAKLEKRQVLNEVRRITLQSSEVDNQISAMVNAMLQFDEEAFVQVIHASTKNKGFEKTVTELIYPLLERVGNLWMTGSVCPAYEHFISNIVRQKIISAIYTLPARPQTSGKKFVLFAPEKEFHEISLLFCQYLLKARGFKTYYIGVNTPFPDLDPVIEKIEPAYLLSIITSFPTGKSLQQFMNQITERFPGVPVILSGYQVKQPNLKIPPGVQVFQDLSSFIRFLDELKH